MGRCSEHDIPFQVVDAYDTSMWYPRYGTVNKGHTSSNYSLYSCKCGLTVNSDRKDFLAVAIKSALMRELSQSLNNLFSQFTRGKVSANMLFRPDDEFLINDAVHTFSTSMESHSF